MVKRNEKDIKLRVIIKAFLCANKGEWYTAKQINDFITGNYFALKDSNISPTIISKLILKDKGVSALRDIEVKQVTNTTKYRVKP